MSSLVKILIFSLIFLGVSLLLPLAMIPLGFSYVSGVVAVVAIQLVIYFFRKSYNANKDVTQTIARQEELFNAAIGRYSNLPAKKYYQSFSCQSCYRENNVEIDLDSDLEFKCSHCGVPHAIYVNFSTAVITTPLVESRKLNNINGI